MRQYDIGRIVCINREGVIVDSILGHLNIKRLEKGETRKGD